MTRLKDPAAVRRIAKKSLFEGLDQMCEGAVIVDREARIVWMSEKYAARLGLASAAEATGRVVEDVIPNSLMRQVVARSVSPEEAVKAYHGALQKKKIKPARDLSDDLQLKEEPLRLAA